MQPLTDRKLNRALEHAGINRVAINDSVDLYPANVWAVDLELVLSRWGRLADRCYRAGGA